MQLSGYEYNLTNNFSKFELFNFIIKNGTKSELNHEGLNMAWRMICYKKRTVSRVEINEKKTLLTEMKFYDKDDKLIHQIGMFSFADVHDDHL